MAGRAVNEVKAGLPPVVRNDARLLILGSLPGDRSLAAERYYAHPTNQFWRLLGVAIGEDLPALDYPARLARLGERRIGLWDVIGSARRPGSLDQAIREAAHNPLLELVAGLGDLEAVAFNGGTAARIGRGLVADYADRLTLLDLPSSSAAFTRSFEEKARNWSMLARYCRPPAAAPR